MMTNATHGRDAVPPAISEHGTCSNLTANDETVLKISQPSRQAVSVGVRCPAAGEERDVYPVQCPYASLSSQG